MIKVKEFMNWLIEFEGRDCQGSLLIVFFQHWQIAIKHWWRKCPFGTSDYLDPYDEACPLCHDEGWIFWYRGWIFELRRWWAYGPGNRIWGWREKRREREQ